MLFVCLSMIVFFMFFFKQKTAYEMRISDWSSDVCSSDLFALREAGVEEVVVVAGFAAEEVEKAVHQAGIRSMRVRLLHNPFYAVSDNLASCWVARHEMTGEFFIINGDTLSEPAIAKRLLDNDKAPTVGIGIARCVEGVCH